jgi:hypothetical protein
MISAMIRPLVLMLAVLTLPRAAAAQNARPLEVSGGYSFVHDPNNHISLEAGWMAGGGVALTDWLAAVVDFGGNYKTISSFGSEVHVSVHAAMGGVRASARVGKVTEFGQVLAGIVRGSGTAFGFVSTSHAFGLQPGIGFEIPLTQRLAGRTELDVRFIHSQPNGNNAGYEYRFVAGIVYRFRR